MKKIILLFLVSFLFILNSAYAHNYSEDNAAYWYIKAFGDLRSKFEKEDLKTIIRIKKYEDYKSIKSELKKDFNILIKELLSKLRKAKEQKKCIFWEKRPENDVELNQYLN